MFGKPFNFTPQAIAYDWVGGAVYASSFEPLDRLIVGKTSPAGESGIVFNVSSQLNYFLVCLGDECTQWLLILTEGEIICSTLIN